MLETYSDQPIVKKAWEVWYNHFGPRTDSAQAFLEQLKLYKKPYKVKAISEIKLLLHSPAMCIHIYLPTKGPFEESVFIGFHESLP